MNEEKLQEILSILAEAWKSIIATGLPQNDEANKVLDSLPIDFACSENEHYLLIAVGQFNHKTMKPIAAVSLMLDKSIMKEIDENINCKEFYKCMEKITNTLLATGAISSVKTIIKV